MKHLQHIGLIITLLVSLSACQDSINNIVNPNNTEDMYGDATYVGQFQRMWQGLDVGYVFWKWETVDWDQVYDTYFPVFAAADQNHRTTGQEGMTLDEYTKAWNAILYPLLDHHLTAALYRPDDPQMERIYISPSAKRQQSADYHRAFTKAEHLACLQAMLDEGKITGHYQVDSALDVEKQMFYFIDGMFSVNGTDSVAYFYISSFMTPHPAMSGADSACTQCVCRWLERLLTQPHVAAIFDTRNNSGGYSSWQSFLGRFFTKTAFYPNVGYCKAGFDRMYYTPASKNWIYPDDKGQIREMSDAYPFICLFDMHSVSNGEEIPWMFSYLPGYVSVGERTCGGMGTLMLDNYTTYYSGTFGNSALLSANYRSTPGNYYCYMSTVANVDARTGKSPEGIGMLPTIPCPLDTVSFFSGRADNQLLRAIDYLKSRQ